MISVIIPAFNEERHISECIAQVEAEEGVSEVIVADGGSTDRTIELAGRHPDVKMLESVRGRGTQMNRGADLALGDILLFLHADTILERGWGKDLVSVLADSSIAGGAFSFAINSPLRRYRFLEQWVRFRCAVFTLPYGDQGIFVRRDIFDQLGGYKDIPLMEDVDFVGRMKKAGRLVMLKKNAYTSERRWAKKGLVLTALTNHSLLLLYRLGVDPHTLAGIYYR
ncbi:MAG: TIGR04283 family arsenosugar biosynthesis glycosyltransferase [Nitrospirae bacterium]|nr:TIGR04283 family arsenosugar biosynthesis glycosyltransferase [Nitrospirota bacterium]